MKNKYEHSNPNPIISIQVKYADGSFDNMNLLQEGDLTLYSLDRKRADKELTSLGAHTDGAIAFLLFITLATKQHTKYSVTDPRVLALARIWQRMFKEII